MHREELAKVFGTPNDLVTHWGITQKDGQRWVKQGHTGTAGVVEYLWPLDALTVANVREWFGAGTFRVYWMTINAEAPEPELRRVPQGNGMIFSLSELPEEEPEVEAEAPAADPVSMALRMMQESDRRANEQTDRIFRLLAPVLERSAGVPAAAAPHPQADAIAELRAELAAERAAREAAEARRAIEDRHREELAAKDREIERLRREAETAERDDGPTFEPGIPLVDQLVAAAANLAVRQPEIAAQAVAAVAPLVSSFLGGKSSPSPAPAPAPPPARVPPRLAGEHPAVPPPPPARPRVSESLTPIGFVAPEAPIPVVGANGEARPPVETRETRPETPPPS